MYVWLGFPYSFHPDVPKRFHCPSSVLLMRCYPPAPLPPARKGCPVGSRHLTPSSLSTRLERGGHKAKEPTPPPFFFHSKKGYSDANLWRAGGDQPSPCTTRQHNVTFSACCSLPCVVSCRRNNGDLVAFQDNHGNPGLRVGRKNKIKSSERKGQPEERIPKKYRTAKLSR